MVTREDLIKGVVKVNDEKQDMQVVAQTSAQKVPRHADSGGATASQLPAGVRARGREAVSPKQESLAEFVSRREGEVNRDLEELTDYIIVHELELKSLRREKELLETELLQLKKVVTYDTSTSTSTRKEVSGAARDGRGGGSASVLPESESTARRGKPRGKRKPRAKNTAKGS